MVAKRKKAGAESSNAENGAKKVKALSKGKTTREVADFRKGLSSLLGGDITVEQFRERHFEKKPLHVKRTNGDTYYGALDDLATPEALFTLMDQGLIPVYRINMFRCRDGSNKEVPDPAPQSVADVRRLFKEGWSIQWLQPQQEHDVLAHLVSVLESEFGTLVGVNAYLTPPGTQGLAPHWDDVEVFVLQLGGEKCWRLHEHTTSSPLPPESQTLPRYSSGDLEASSLSPVLMEPKLHPGDLLYFPRGTIHYAPNQNSKKSSVHLTISGFQRQTLYDLTQKTFEEAMSELWEDDEELRRALPWRSFAPGSPSHPELVSAVAKVLRRLSDAIGKEAKTITNGKEHEDGCVANAVAELGAEFVRHRMPPQQIGEDAEEVCSVSIVSPDSIISIVDPSALAMLPLPGSDDGSVELIHYSSNSRRNHMMTHPESTGSEVPTQGDGGEEIDEEIEPEEEEEEEEEDDEDEEEDGMSDSGSGGIKVSGHVAQALKVLCEARGRCREPLEKLLLKGEVPEAAWSEVCTVMTQLAALGLVCVSSEPAKQSKRSKKSKKAAR